MLQPLSKYGIIYLEVKMKGVIYCYKPNEKYYVGKTYTKESKRQKQHKHDAMVRNANTPFACAIRKYGWEEVKKTYSVLETVEAGTLEELNKLLCEKENFYIDKLNSMIPNGYNVHYSNHKKPPKLSNKEERYKKTSESLKGKYMNQSYSSKRIICIETGIEYPSISECERQMGFKHNTIGAVLHGKVSNHQGYTFKYVNGDTELKKIHDRNKNVICLETNEIYKNTREVCKVILGNKEKGRTNLINSCKYGWGFHGKHYRYIIQGNIVPCVQYSKKHGV